MTYFVDRRPPTPPSKMLRRVPSKCPFRQYQCPLERSGTQYKILKICHALAPTVNHYPLGGYVPEGCTPHVLGVENVFDRGSSSSGKCWLNNTKFGTLIELHKRYKMVCVSLRRGARCMRYARASNLHPSTKLHLLSGLQGKRSAQTGQNLQTIKRH